MFRLYTSLELKAESERQAAQLWGEGYEQEPATPYAKGMWAHQVDTTGQEGIRPHTRRDSKLARKIISVD